MRKLQKATVMAVVLGSFGFLGAGTAYAHGEKGGTDIDIKQGSQCRSHDTNVDVLGEVGILNGLAGNAIGGEGSPGAQSTRMGSSMGCDNSADFKESKSHDEDRGGGSEGRGSEGRGSEGRGSEGREGNGDKGGDAHKCGCSDGGEGKEGREQQGMTPQPGLRYTVRTETLTTP
ncbi:hypothetical protein GCM10010211_16460 [Streptomyces albospinus]|uniref:Secreted protein n=1 Tax=Streptomyces albospinus TaxID=285515 RepID=A0ABQ2UTD3_9ACTN|nr:hypothetical protein [Streptomyces albospinus]GGU52708.1 hypothetical protein GCM10010211_16460 [Streptomyces albospinus]